MRPFAVAKCDLDDAMLRYRMGLKLRVGRALGIVDPDFERYFGGLFDTPLPFGHECVAEVVDVGDRVVGVQVGDLVSVPFKSLAVPASTASRATRQSALPFRQ